MELVTVLSTLGLGSASPEGWYEVSRDQFAALVSRAFHECGLSLSLMYATDDTRAEKVFRVHAVLSVPASHAYLTLRTTLPENDPRYPSVTAMVMAAHWYERLMGDQFGIEALGHPDWRRLVHHENIPAATYPLKKEFAWNTQLAHAHEPYPMHRVEGKGVYEIPVGPIHAGIIEPGHFRFNVMGERILTLEGKLFFKHKGVEKLLEGKTPEEAMPFIERVSGDMAVGHALAFVQAVEAASGIVAPSRAQFLRVILLELERITMHFHDISNIGGNGTALSFMYAQGARIVERLRRMHEKMYGHRFLRGTLVPGGVAHGLDTESFQMIEAELSRSLAELVQLEVIVRNSDSFMERLETTGVLKLDAAIAYGAVGLPARASGVDRDVRRDHPFAAYDQLSVRVTTKETGDVSARFFMRFDEIRESVRLIIETIKSIPNGPVQIARESRPGSALGSCESWRGEIIDWVRLDAQGKIDRAVVRDPSFCNWPLFGEIGPGNIVPDFPICNKSLNLSYSGTDL